MTTTLFYSLKNLFFLKTCSWFPGRLANCCWFTASGVPEVKPEMDPRAGWAKRDQKKKQATPDWWVEDVISKETCIWGLSWMTEWSQSHVLETVPGAWSGGWRSIPRTAEEVRSLGLPRSSSWVNHCSFLSITNSVITKILLPPERCWREMFLFLWNVSPDTSLFRQTYENIYK